MRSAPRSTAKADPCCPTPSETPLKPLTSVPPHSRGKGARNRFDSFHASRSCRCRPQRRLRYADRSKRRTNIA